MPVSRLKSGLALAILLLPSMVSSTVPIRIVEPRPVCSDAIRKMAEAAGTVDRAVILADSILCSYGYLDARIDSSDSGLTLVANERYRINSIVVTGDSSFSKIVDQYLTQELYAQLAGEIIEPLQRRGYYYVTLAFDSVRFGEAAGQLMMNLSKGPLVRAGHYRLDGLVRSNPRFTERFLPQIEGGPLTPGLLNRIGEAAERIEHLRLLNQPAVAPQPGYNSADILLRFREAKPLMFEGGFGYQREEAENELIWNLKLELVNLFGGGKKASLYSSRPNKDRTLLQIGYRQPLFLISPAFLSLSLATRDFRDQFYEFESNGAYEFRFGSNLTGSIGVGWKSVSPADDRSDYKRLSLDLGFSRSRSSYRKQREGGTDLSWLLSYRSRKQSATENAAAVRYDDTYTKLLLDRFQPLAVSLGLRSRLGVETIQSDQNERPLSELILIGGPPELRGFRSQQFAVVSVGTISLEPYYASGKSRIYLFYDGAYIDPATTADSSGGNFYRFGYGFGFELRDDERSVELSLGWSEDIPFDQPRLAIKLRSDI